jgi:hypothetical protein
MRARLTAGRGNIASAATTPLRPEFFCPDDLILDDDQKDLWQEAQTAKNSQSTFRLRAEAVGLGEAALTENSGITIPHFAHGVMLPVRRLLHNLQELLFSAINIRLLAT